MEEVGVALDRMEGDVLEEADGEKKNWKSQLESCSDELSSISLKS